jgi:hypothetical protein
MRNLELPMIFKKLAIPLEIGEYSPRFATLFRQRPVTRLSFAGRISAKLFSNYRRLSF